MFKQKNNYGCGLYAVANALNQESFITEERLAISKDHGNIIGQLSKWLQEDGEKIYIDALYYNHVGKKLPSTALSYYPENPNHAFPVLFNVQFSEKGLRHLIGGKINHDKELYLYDSLKDDVEVTTIAKMNRSYYRVFGFFIFMDVDKGNYIFLS